MTAWRRRRCRRGWRRSCDAALARILTAWPDDLPRGQIHADLFPDNVFFLDGKVSGLIDFYFAATDFLAYDVAVCLNAWCFEPDLSFNVTKARALLGGYAAQRPLSAAELRALPVLAQGAAIRFALTRLYDWVHTPAGALVTRKDPRDYVRRLRFHLAAARTPPPMASDTLVEVWTDGGARPNPGPGGWGAVLRYGGVERELSGADPATTNNRMELTAACAALEALTRRCRVVVHTDSEYVRNGITRWHTGWVRRNWRNAAGDPVANMDLWRRLLAAAAAHEVEWKWVRGHAGDAMNERADRLATAAREALGAG